MDFLDKIYKSKAQTNKTFKIEGVKQCFWKTGVYYHKFNYFLRLRDFLFVFLLFLLLLLFLRDFFYEIYVCRLYLNHTPI